MTPVSKQKMLGVLALVSAAGLSLTSCGGGGSEKGEDLTGTVTVDGSSTVAPLTTAAAEGFARVQPKVRVIVGTSGTGGGFEKFCNGETDLSDASRPIEDEEKAACARNDVSYQALQVANDALTVVVNKNADWVNCLTTGQLRKIWQPGSKVTRWSQIAPSFPDVPVKLFGPGTDSGTFDYFTKEINGKEGASRTDYSPSEDDNVTVRGVAGSQGGMGYFGFSYYEQNADKLKALKIDDGEGCVAPGVKAAQDNTYRPLSRPLYVYPSAVALKRAQVLAFVRYYVDNNKSIARDALFVPLNSGQEAKLRSDLTRLKEPAS